MDMPSSRRIVRPLCSLLAGLLLGGAVSAASFPSGDCTFANLSNGLNLIGCTNLTGGPVNDVHLTVFLPFSGLPVVNVDRDFSTVASGGAWRAGNILIWGSSVDQVGDIMISGASHWTLNGAMVPELSSLWLTLAGLPILLARRWARRKMLTHH
jgi:hypothetical protein